MHLLLLVTPSGYFLRAKYTVLGAAVTGMIYYEPIPCHRIVWIGGAAPFFVCPDPWWFSLPTHQKFVYPLGIDKISICCINFKDGGWLPRITYKRDHPSWCCKFFCFWPYIFCGYPLGVYTSAFPSIIWRFSVNMYWPRSVSRGPSTVWRAFLQCLFSYNMFLIDDWCINYVWFGWRDIASFPFGDLYPGGNFIYLFP